MDSKSDLRKSGRKRNQCDFDFNIESNVKRFNFPKINVSGTEASAETKTAEKITVKCSSKNGKSRVWDKRYCCVYCEKPYAKIARHFEDKHKTEADVAKLIDLIPTKHDAKETKKLKFSMRRKIIDDLRRKGNYNHNIVVLKRGFGELIVKRCPTKTVLYTSFLPCEFCLDFYYRKDLHRHIKTCPLNKKTAPRSGSHVQGSAAMLLPVHPEVSDALKKIFERFKVDVSICLKLDPTIIKYGNVLCRKHYNNSDQTYHISNKLRELGRLLLKMRSTKEVKILEHIINPSLFPLIVKSVTEMCGWNEELKQIETPSLGIKLGQLMKKVAFLIKGEAIINGQLEKRKMADDFLSILEMRWNDEIAKVSRIELETRKWNKPKLLPLTEDLQLLKQHLSNVRVTSINELPGNNSSLESWRNLCSSILASLILLNRRRAGEASKLELVHLNEMCNDVPSNDIKSALSEFEVKLCSYFKRVEIRGKRGRKVPMLITQQSEKAIKLLVNLREHVGVNVNNKYVFAIPTMGSLQYLRGSDALRKHVNFCSLKCPQAITSTKLRKHIATLSQLLNLEERELGMLAGFLGHNISVHREFYRLPENTLQLAKCGKILMMLDQGKIADFAGKSLDEIELEMDGTYLIIL